MATLGNIDAVIEDLIRVSRPTSPQTRYTAINYGYSRCIDAIVEARPEYFLQEAAITLPAGVMRYRLNDSNLFPQPVKRIKNIVAVGPQSAALETGIVIASERVVDFRYASMETPEFQQAQRFGARESDVIFYDMVFVDGGIPVLAFAPALSSAMTVLVSTIFRPQRLTDPGSSKLMPIIEQHQECPIAYAMDWLLGTVNDAERGMWEGKGDKLKAELVQAVATVSLQNTEHLGSDLMFGDAC